MTCHYPLPAGTFFTLNLLNEIGQPVDLQYRVMHARRIGLTDVWVIGAKLDRLLTPQTVDPKGPLAIFLNTLIPPSIKKTA